MSQPEATQPLHVLVVDDERDVEHLFRQRFRREIRKEQIRFTFAFSGEEALAYLRGDGETNVVLVLSDINMPGMTGLELLRHIKEERAELPVHMITAYGEDRNFRTAQELGADGYFTKPLDFSALKEQIMA